jgi:long-chain fatty acid transport protein
LVTSANGNLAAALPALAAAPWARLDFSNSSKFSGEAKSVGYAAKLGLLWQARTDLRVGAALHLKTQLKDMRSSGSATTLSAPGFADVGRIVVQDFQMPQQLAVGAAWQATPDWLLAADVKHIGWSDVMDSFRMRFESSGMGGNVSFALPQKWKDQTVVQLGAARRLGDWTVRGGLNLASNPVPDTLVNPLFPAIVKNHLTLGAGYRLSGAGEVNASMAYAPTVSVSTPTGVVVSHRQLNMQLMYSHRF